MGEVPFRQLFPGEMDVMDVEGFDGPAETSRAGGAWRLAVASGAMACFVVYAVYMAAFLIALRYGLVERDRDF